MCSVQPKAPQPQRLSCFTPLSMTIVVRRRDGVAARGHRPISTSLHGAGVLAKEPRPSITSRNHARFIIATCVATLRFKLRWSHAPLPPPTLLVVGRRRGRSSVVRAQICSGANCSSVGSAQQNHGSLSRGINTCLRLKPPSSNMRRSCAAGPATCSASSATRSKMARRLTFMLWPCCTARRTSA